MSQKLGRAYILEVENNDGTTTTIDSTISPFTLEFDITRNTFSSSNVAKITLINLSEKTRALLRKDVTNLYDNRTVTLRAGYGKNLSVVFNGNITQAFSYREGVNFLSLIESFDGGFAFTTSLSNVSFPAFTPMRSVIARLVQDLGSDITLGAIGNSYSGDIGPRGNSYSGSTTSLLRDLSNGQFFVDGGKAYFLADNECINGSLTTISSETGLLNTPMRQNTIIVVDTIFEPRVICGQFVTLESSSDKSFNGDYAIRSVKHRGVISPVVSGDAITTLGLDNSAQALSIVPVQTSI